MKLNKLNSGNMLLVLMMSAVVAGVALGIGLRYSHIEFTTRNVMYLNFPGEIFLRMLKMLILPLIVSSLVCSLAQLQISTAGRLGYLTTAFFFFSTFAAVVQGIILVLIIHPGHGDNSANDEIYEHNDKSEELLSSECQSYPVDAILDLLRNLFPENMIYACFGSSRTCATIVNETSKATNEAHKGPSMSTGGLVERIQITDVAGINILGIVMLAIAFGAAISALANEATALKHLFESLEKVSMKLVKLVVWYGVIGSMFLIAAQIVQMQDPVKELTGLGLYVLTVLVGLCLHGFVMLPLAYFVLVRKNPFKHTAGVAQALVTALGTDSSSATLPVTMNCLEENLNIDPRVSRFVCPLGATINMNGSALYEAVAAIYIAQVLGQTLSIGQIILISLTATLAAVGAAGIPSAGLVTLLMVLTAVDLPSEYAALILPVDWFLDRIRTVVNVYGDTIGAAVVNKFCAKELSLSRKDSELQTLKLSRTVFRNESMESAVTTVCGPVAMETALLTNKPHYNTLPTVL